MFEGIAKRRSRNKCGMTESAEAGMTDAKATPQQVRDDIVAGVTM
jgi:hypothetical protein